MITVSLVNPFSGASVEHDVTNATQDQIDAYAQILDDETLSELEDDYETPAHWLQAFVEKVGAVEAGRVILGS